MLVSKHLLSNARAHHKLFKRVLIIGRGWLGGLSIIIFKKGRRRVTHQAPTCTLGLLLANLFLSIAAGVGVFALHLRKFSLVSSNLEIWRRALHRKN